MRKFLLSLWELIKIALIALVIIVPIRYFVFQPFLVKGASMEPNFQNGDYLIIDEISYRFREPQRGEVIVFKYPQDLSQRYIKRIIGLPGEMVLVNKGQIIISPVPDESFPDFLQIPFNLDESAYLPSSLLTSGQTKLKLSEEEYFVLGDNRLASSDSRRWGALSRENIIGRVFLRLWPPSAMAKIEAPVY